MPLDAARRKVAARFARTLGDETLGGHLETCLFNHTVRTCERDRVPLYWDCPRFRFRYTTRALQLDFNLRHPRNPALGDMVRDRELSLKKFAAMSPTEMFPELWEPAFQRVAARQLRRMAGTLSALDAPDGAYTCGRCKSKKTVYTGMQIRSADEPQTLFVSCLNCGKKWKD